MVVHARLCWLRDQVVAGVAAHLTFGAAAIEGRGKVKVVLDPARPSTSPTARAVLLSALAALEEQAGCAVVVDRGHRFSDGRTEVCFWLSARSAARPEAGGPEAHLGGRRPEAASEAGGPPPPAGGPEARLGGRRPSRRPAASEARRLRGPPPRRPAASGSSGAGECRGPHPAWCPSCRWPSPTPRSTSTRTASSTAATSTSACTCPPCCSRASRHRFSARAVDASDRE